MVYLLSPMDNADWGLQFLDLSGASEADQSKIERALSGPPKCVQLPWPVTRDDEPLVADQQWSPVQYDERSGVEDAESGDPRMPEASEEAGEAPQAPRNQVYPPMVYIVPPGVYLPPMYNSPQHYVYPEMDTAPRPPMPRNTNKKVDKKSEGNYAMSYVVQYSQPMYPPVFHPMPMYTDYQPNYVPPPEPTAAFTGDEPPFVPASAAAPPVQAVEVTAQPLVQDEPAPIESFTEFPAHEHLCYHANVTLKPPKKKQVEPTVVETVAVEAANDPVTSLSEECSIPPETEASPLTEPISVVDETSTTAEIDVANHRGARNDFPDLGSSGQHTSAPATGNVVKSWVSLFSSGTVAPGAPVTTQPFPDPKPRPLARVTPLDKNGTPSFTKTEQVSPTYSSKMAPPMLPSPVTNGSNFVDDPYLHRLSEILSSYKLDHRAVSVQPRGLTNRSNWCYVNAILQALIACPSFYNLMKSIPPPTNKRTSSSPTPITDALVEFVNLFPPLAPNARKRDKRNKEDATDLLAGSSFEPAGIYKVLDKIRGDNGFTVEGRQEDAEEFLSCLLNGLNDEMFEVLKLADNGPTGLTNGDASDEAGDGWKEKMGRKNKGSVTRRTVCGNTPISQIFRGQLRNRVQRAGDEYTDNVQPFFTLQLDVEKAGSVKEALELLVGKDPLEGMTCSKTNQEIEAWTQISLEDLPLILILHLKCFDYKHDGCSKITKSVAFTVELKVDPKLMSVNKSKYIGKQRNYKLVAVVYHDGKEATKGHYVTDAYHVGLGCWIRYDDGIVRSVSEESVLKPKSPCVPYLLYYRRADTVSAQSRP